MLGIAWDRCSAVERPTAAVGPSGALQSSEVVEHRDGVVRYLDDHGRPLGVDLDGEAEEAAASLLAPGEVYEPSGGGWAVSEPELDTTRSCPGRRRHRCSQGVAPFLSTLCPGTRGEGAGDRDLHAPTIGAAPGQTLSSTWQRAAQPSRDDDGMTDEVRFRAISTLAPRRTISVTALPTRHDCWTG
jgi:hypothetical protein